MASTASDVAPTFPDRFSCFDVRLHCRRGCLSPPGCPPVPPAALPRPSPQRPGRSPLLRDPSKAAPPACASQPEAGGGSSTFPPPHLTCSRRRRSLVPSATCGQLPSCPAFCPCPAWTSLTLAVPGRHTGLLVWSPASRPFYEAIGEVHGTQAPCAQQGSASAGPAQSASWGPAAPLGSRLLLTAGTVRGPSPLSHLRGPLGPCDSDPRIMLIRKVTFT